MVRVRPKTSASAPEIGLLISGRTLGHIAVVALALGASACSDLETERTLPPLDETHYRCAVEPVLARDCSYFACHGSAERPLRLYAPGRLRLDVPPVYVLDPLTEPERAANLASVLGLAAGEDLEDSLLLLKPLDSDAGGYFHVGKSMFGGGDVFATKSAPGYLAIEAWLGGAADYDAECRPLSGDSP